MKFEVYRRWLAMAARMVFKNGSEEGFKSEVGGGYRIVWEGKEE